MEVSLDIPIISAVCYVLVSVWRQEPYVFSFCVYAAPHTVRSQVRVAGVRSYCIINN